MTRIRNISTIVEKVNNFLKIKNKTVEDLFFEKNLSIEISDELQLRELYERYSKNCRYLPDFMGGGFAYNYYLPDYRYYRMGIFGYIEPYSIPLKCNVSFEDFISIEESPFVDRYQNLLLEESENADIDLEIIERFRNSVAGEVIFIRSSSKRWPTKTVAIKINDKQFEEKIENENFN